MAKYPVNDANPEVREDQDSGAQGDERIGQEGPSAVVLGHKVSFADMIPESQKEAIAENYRKVESTRGLVLEAINVLYREGNVKNLRFYRRRVEEAQTFDELRIAVDLLMTLGMFFSK